MDISEPEPWSFNDDDQFKKLVDDTEKLSFE